MCDRDEFYYGLDKSLAWRSKELTVQYMALKKSLGLGGSTEYMIKAAYVLLYSHMQGFITDSTKFFLKHLVAQSIEVYTMQENFFYIGMGEYHSELISPRKYDKVKNLHEYMEFRKKSYFEVCADKFFKNESANYNDDTFQSVCKKIGIDSSDFLLKDKYLTTFVSKRNKIAHGDYFDSKYLEDLGQNYDETYHRIKKLMAKYKETLEICIEKKQYLKEQYR